MLRIRTLDLETSPSALPAAQGTNKCGSISVLEDSNLRFCNIDIKCSTCWAEKKMWVDLCKNLQVNSVKWKVLVDFS